MTKAQLRAALAPFGLEDETDFLHPYTSIEIALVAATEKKPKSKTKTKPKPKPKAKTTSDIARTRLGGAPLVPAKGFEWPEHRWPLSEVETWPKSALREVKQARALGQVRDVDGQLAMPLSFVAQIDLAEITKVRKVEDLPDHGLLLFFASIGTDVDDPLFAKRVASTVRWIDDTKPLVPMEQPATVDPCPASVVELRPEARLYCTLPFADRKALSKRVGTKIMKRFADQIGEGPDVFLPAPSYECAGPMPPPGEVALLRISENDEASFFIGDASWLTFSIPKKDLHARRFAAARASVFIG